MNQSKKLSSTEVFNLLDNAFVSKDHDVIFNFLKTVEYGHVENMCNGFVNSITKKHGLESTKKFICEYFESEHCKVSPYTKGIMINPLFLLSCLHKDIEMAKYLLNHHKAKVYVCRDIYEDLFKSSREIFELLCMQKDFEQKNIPQIIKSTFQYYCNNKDIEQLNELKFFKLKTYAGPKFFNTDNQEFNLLGFKIACQKKDETMMKHFLLNRSKKIEKAQDLEFVKESPQVNILVSKIYLDEKINHQLTPPLENKTLKHKI